MARKAAFTPARAADRFTPQMSLEVSMARPAAATSRLSRLRQDLSAQKLVPAALSFITCTARYKHRRAVAASRPKEKRLGNGSCTPDRAASNCGCRRTLRLILTPTPAQDRST